MGADRLDLPVNSATADLCSILSVENGAGVLRAIVEGWYLDLPYAVFLVGVNYSPLEYPQLGAPLGSCQSRNQEHREGWFDADLIELVKNHLRRGRRRRAIKFEDRFHGRQGLRLLVKRHLLIRLATPIELGTQSG
jgi:hypothetical protein